jgi:hypothetical protein
VSWDDAETHWLGPAAKARLDASPDARQRIEEIHPLGEFSDADGRPRQLTWAHDLDKLGRTTGERSFVGVIHFDGNAMGARFRDAARSDLEAFRQLSEAVTIAARQALGDALDWVRKCLGGITDRAKGGFDLASDAEGCCFPVRPIVYGGDDMTLVCDGRIALDLAARLLHAWHQRTGVLPGGAAHACAGIALVKSHYPFYRAYRLAEELCRHAKHRLDDRNQASALDWEIVEGGGIESVAERRADSITRDERPLKLHARPYVVVGAPPVTGPYRAWDWFRDKLLKELQTNEDFHTQYKGLAATLHEGRDATREHLQRWRDRFARTLPEPRGFAFDGGFAHDETPYLDALDLMDRILPLACFAAGNEPRS